MLDVVDVGRIADANDLRPMPVEDDREHGPFVSNTLQFVSADH